MMSNLLKARVEDNLKPHAQLLKEDLGCHLLLLYILKQKLNALKARQKLLKDKYELEDQEKQLQKRKEETNLQGEIEAQIAKLNVLKSHSATSNKSGHSGEKSNLEPYQRKTLDANAKSFVPQVSAKKQGSMQDCLKSGARSKKRIVQQTVLF